MKKCSLVILVGGRGTRISKFSKGIPKPLIKFNNISFLDLILNYYSKYDFHEIILLAGYKSEFFEKKYHNTFKNFIKIKVVKENKPLGTGGAISRLKKIIKNDFLLLNGDSYFEVDLNKIKKIQRRLINIFLVKNFNYKSNKKLSSLSIDKKNKIIFSQNANDMNSGVIYFRKKIFDLFPKKKIFSLEDNFLSKLISKKVVYGTKEKGFFIDIGTPINLRSARKNLKKILVKPAVFLDRDGVINIDKGYTHKIKDLKYKPNILNTLKSIAKKRYLLFIVTNQAGVAKKKFSTSSFFKFQINMKRSLIKHKIYIDDIRYCFYHPEAKIKKYKKNSKFRKPGNLMIESLFKSWFVDKKKSFMIGDKPSDYKAAKKSNLDFVYTSKNINKIIKKKLLLV
jgi:D,D-heptose 1,7-bisphosphate phosphatase